MASVEELSEQLRDELDANERESMPDELRDELEHGDRREFVKDTRTVPARFHHLFAVGQSPAHGLAALRENRDRDTLALRLGAGVHAMVFGKPFVRFDGKRDKRTKKYKEFLAEHAGKVIMSPGEYARAEAIATALRGHEIAGPLLFGAGKLTEHTILWEQHGRKRRSTPDVHDTDEVVELKTARCAELERFAWDSSKRGYHAQVADQVAAVEASTGRRPKRAFIVVVETVWPHVVTVRRLTERALERGAWLCRTWLDRLIYCEETGEWPGYTTGIEPLDVPDDSMIIDYGANDDGVRAEVDF